MTKKPTYLDAFFLSCFVVLITFQPYFLYGQINIFEVGLYLPGINALLHGLVPYRDFFHLRGPFELYMPAFLMKIFGVHIGVLSLYFYIGTIVTLILCVLLAKELYRTRLILYLMVPVVIARTFPRVVFTYWGGMRYAFGILALLCAVKYFKREKMIWIFFAGVVSACGIFTSIEIGVCAISGVLLGLGLSAVFKLRTLKTVWYSVLVFGAGIAVITIPYIIYLSMTHSLFPFIDSVYAVVIKKDSVINTLLVSQVPRNFLGLLKSIVLPTSKNFRQLTPVYFYIILAFYWLGRMRNKKINQADMGIVVIATYGLIMYNAAFRNIWAAQFEMALQPEKILFFLMLEKIYLFLLAKKEEIKHLLTADKVSKKFTLGVIYVLVFGLIVSSLGYSFDRYNKRFFTFQYLRNKILGKSIEKIKPLAKIPSRPLVIERARGMVVPNDQADEFEAIADFFSKNTLPNETVFMFPELGTYSFLVDRPFLGRFPISTFSWFNDRWYEELVSDFTTAKPRFVVVLKEFPVNWKEVYLGNEGNCQKYYQFTKMIESQYILKTQTPQSYIYVRRDQG